MKKLDSNTFDELLQEQEPFLRRPPSLDLREIEFVSPAGLAQLAACSYQLAEKKQRPRILVDDPGVRSYLVRAGFATAVEPVADIVPPLNGDWGRYLRGSNPMLLEVTRIESASVLPDLLDRILLVLRQKLRYRETDAYDIAIAVSEVTQNTFDHNSHSHGFLSMQVYKSNPPFLEIGIADHGNGLLKTLRRNAKYKEVDDDKDAIAQCIRLGTSEHDDITRGTGLYHLLEITYKHEGAVQIRSGSAKVRYRMDKRQGWFFSVPSMGGVQIALNLPSKVSR
jgi:hypothetical protein